MKSKSAFRILSDEEIKGIYNLSLKIIGEIGVKITNEKGLKLLRSGGCEIDENKRVKIPESLVNEIIKYNTGREAKLYYRDSPKCIKFDDELFFSLDPLKLDEMLTGGTQSYVFDLDRFERRQATEEDVKNAVLLADALDNIKTVGVPVTPYDAPPKTRGLHALAIAVQYTNKPIMWVHVQDLEMAKLAIEVESVLVGGMEELRKRPIHTALLEGISPLRYDDRMIDLLLFYAEQGIPAFSISSMPTPGATGPLSIPASIALNIAEIIPGLYLTNLANPKMKLAPAMPLAVCYKNVWAMDVMPLNPYNLRHLYAAPETVLVGLAETQFIRECFGFPVWGTRALRTDAKAPDIQAALEKAMGAMLATLAGATALGPVGQVDSDQIFCFEQLVIDNEIMNLLKRVERGIISYPEDFDLEMVRRGVEKGNFLTEPLTLKRLRETIYLSDLLDRERYEDWIKKGKRSILARAQEKVVNLLKYHETTAEIDSDIIKKIQEILKKADKQFLKA